MPHHQIEFLRSYERYAEQDNHDDIIKKAREASLDDVIQVCREALTKNHRNIKVYQDGGYALIMLELMAPEEAHIAWSIVKQQNDEEIKKSGFPFTRSDSFLRFARTLVDAVSDTYRK